MVGSWLVALGIALAIASQLLLVVHIARRWRSIPRKVPYGTLPGPRYFLWGPKEIMWTTPGALLAVIVYAAANVATAPSFIRSQPFVALSFIAIALCMPLLRRAIDEKIDAARARER